MSSSKISGHFTDGMTTKKSLAVKYKEGSIGLAHDSLSGNIILGNNRSWGWGCEGQISGQQN